MYHQFQVEVRNSRESSHERAKKRFKHIFFIDYFCLYLQTHKQLDYKRRDLNFFLVLDRKTECLEKAAQGSWKGKWGEMLTELSGAVEKLLLLS